MGKKIKIGDKVVFGRGKKNKELSTSGYGLVIGKVYEVVECCGCPAIQFDPDLMPVHMTDFETDAKITKVVGG